MEIGEHQWPGRGLGGDGGRQRVAHHGGDPREPGRDSIGHRRNPHGAGEGQLEADVGRQIGLQSEHHRRRQRQRDEDVAIALHASGDDDQDAHACRPQGCSRRAGKQGIAGHCPHGNERRGSRHDPPHPLVDDARQQAHLESGDHDDMDESAGNHLLL